VDFAKAKKDFWLHNNFHRQQSNNSVMFKSRPTQDDIAELFDLMQEAGGSEPGFINMVEGKRRAPWISGVNPCVTGDTLILTDEGYQPIAERVGKPTHVWNGEVFSEVVPFSTGINPLVDVILSDGTSLRCTPYHEWILAGGVRVMAEELSAGDRLEKFAMPVVEAGENYSGDAYSQGFYSGDGVAEASASYIYEPKWDVVPRLKGKVSEDILWERRRWVHGPMFSKNFVPVNGSLDYCLNWLAGVMDADGTVTRDENGNGLQLTSVDKSFLLNVRLMLTRLGVRAKIVAGRAAGMRLLPNGLGGAAPYACAQSWRLLIGNTDTHRLVELGIKFNRLKVHSNAPQRDARRFVTVVAVERDRCCGGVVA
jgi:ribonucleoside-diphosphate reductase alpha chain